MSSFLFIVVVVVCASRYSRHTALYLSHFCWGSVVTGQSSLSLLHS